MLVIRVKRNRDDDPAETICLLEDAEVQNGQVPQAKEELEIAGLPPVKKRKKKISLQELSLQQNISDSNHQLTEDNSKSEPSSETRLKQNKLFLRRIRTIENPSLISLDTETIQFVADEGSSTKGKKRGADEHDEDSNLEKDNSLEKTSSSSKRAKMMVTQGKRAVPVKGQESCIIVDMMQVYQPLAIPPTTAGSTTPVKTASTPTKVLDPPTRLLAKGIQTAIQTGNFNDISSALIQGANPNFQLNTAQGGYTTLMAAVLKANLRMVKRLLTSRVDVLVVNSEGLTAIELLQKPGVANRFNTSDVEEIKTLLQKETLKAYHQRSSSESRSVHHATTANATSTEFKPSDKEENYVVDIYCIDTTYTEETEMNREENVGANTSAHAVLHSSSSMPSKVLTSTIVTVEGLKITEDGQVELLSYDSDWSDLADDEDPDSNDERYFANDYPDESDEDGGGKLFNDENDEDEEERGGTYYRRAQGAYGEDDYDLNSDDSEDERGGRGPSNFRNRPIKSTAYKASSTNQASRLFTKTGVAAKRAGKKAVSFEAAAQIDGLDYGDDECDAMGDAEIDAALDEMFEDGSKGIPIFDHYSSIGKVMKPHYLPSSSSSTAVALPVSDSIPQTSESLRELWGIDSNTDHLDPCYSTEGALCSDQSSSIRAVVGEEDKNERLAHMRQRTNMLFASNPREFDQNGLAKYGEELSESDEEIDEFAGNRTTTAAFYSSTLSGGKSSLPPKDTVAFDPELDMDSDE